MPVADFDRVLALYWPTLLPPLRRGGHCVLVYFAQNITDGQSSWILVSEAVIHPATVPILSLGARVRVRGSSKTVAGVELVYSTGISLSDVPEPAGVDPAGYCLPELFWPLVVFGSALSTNAAALRPTLKLISVNVERRADMQDAPVIVRVKLDPNTPHVHAMFSPHVMGFVAISGSLEDVSGGQISVRVGRLTLSEQIDGPSSAERVDSGEPRAVFSFWSRISAIAKLQMARAGHSLGVRRESPALRLLREVYAPAGSNLTAVTLTLSLSGVSV